MFKNYYEKLGLQDNASDDEIKKAYKKLAIKYHPDKQINSSQQEKVEAEKNFKIIAEAYEILTNKDKYRKHSFNNIHSTRGFVDPHEIFNQIFRDMNIGNIGNRHSNISISIPQNIQGSCVMKTSSISIQNGRKVETIQETINGVTRQRVIITDLNNN
tara:strand:+ start:135 stop:608 length:474 start_codon:yes stop_codon:yes gene_type:complete